MVEDIEGTVRYLGLGFPQTIFSRPVAFLLEGGRPIQIFSFSISLGEQFLL